MIELKINASSPEQLRSYLAALLGSGAVPVTLAVGGGGGAGTSGVATETVKDAAEDPKPKTTRTTTKKDEPKVEEPKEEPKVEEPKIEVQGGVAVEGLSYDDDVKPAILRLSMSKGREAVFRVLKQFGAEKSAQEIAPEKWAEVIDAVDEELKTA